VTGVDQRVKSLYRDVSYSMTVTPTLGAVMQLLSGQECQSLGMNAFHLAEL